LSALDDILALVHDPDPYRNAPADLATLQLEAARERFAQHRESIKVLGRRSQDAGIGEIRSLDDLVPLLFVHTNYKSYPETFVDKSQWGHLNLWLQTLTSKPVKDVDLDGVADADDWLARLADAGHYLFTSSGTSGKASFLDQSAKDVELSRAAYQVGFARSNHTFQADNSRVAFCVMPPTGSHRLCGPASEYYRSVARPGEVHYLSTDPMTINPSIRAGQLRRAIGAGTARPEEVAAAEAEAAQRQQKGAAAFEAWVEKIHARRHEPVIFGFMWKQAFDVMQALRARGVKDGDFHPETVMAVGGGLKGVVLPDDFKDQINRFYGLSPNQISNSYAMTEMTGLSPYIPWLGGYAFPPWIVALVLDKAGEVLLNPKKGEIVEGRMALYDLVSDARWGGLISGDKVTVDFSDVGDGIKVPLVRTIARYADLEEGEDKLTCAGTIDSYVRGAIAA
jgi:hypothetical protein